MERGTDAPSQPQPTSGTSGTRGTPRPPTVWQQRQPPTHRLIACTLPDAAAERARLREGLLAAEASIEPKHFYDPAGCALFDAICRLPEYYLTRTEAAIFARHRTAIAGRLPAGGQWVDLGCGDGAKSRAWLEAAAARRFVGVDIARGSLEAALAGIAACRRRIERVGVLTDLGGMTWPLALGRLLAERPGWPPVFFYPGSSLGNFAPAAAHALLRSIRGQVGGDGALLIGVDLVKDRRLLEAAYDDAQGITAAFNRNVLRVANRRLGADFEPARFAHEATFNAGAGRIEMRLRATTAQTVRIDGGSRRFHAGEAILTEYSHKYTLTGFGDLLAGAGFGRIEAWTDARGWYGVFLARP